MKPKGYANLTSFFLQLYTKAAILEFIQKNPDEIRLIEVLPKTRSGKIMRRLLREIATQGIVSGDTTTLEDYSVLEKLREGEE
jgi:acyl-CoA synthetase (AMP-forming)/AMP-acid ligase II